MTHFLWQYVLICTFVFVYLFMYECIYLKQIIRAALGQINYSGRCRLIDYRSWFTLQISKVVIPAINRCRRTSLNLLLTRDVQIIFQEITKNETTWTTWTTNSQSVCTHSCSFQGTSSPVQWSPVSTKEFLMVSTCSSAHFELSSVKSDL